LIWRTKQYGKWNNISESENVNNKNRKWYGPKNFGLICEWENDSKCKFKKIEKTNPILLRIKMKLY